jgi:hypothetical protein
MYDQGDNANLTDDQKRKKRRDLQMEIIMQESDLNKVVAEKTRLEMEIRQLRKDMDRTRIVLQEKQQRQGKVDFEILQQQEAIMKNKKKMNML